VLGAASVAVVILGTGLETMANSTALGIKVAYGAALAVLVTPAGLRAALARRDSWLFGPGFDGALSLR
jgi:hypothetical protein